MCRGIYILHPDISIFVNKNVYISKTFDILSIDTIIKLVEYTFINIIRYFINKSNNTFHTLVKYIRILNKDICILVKDIYILAKDICILDKDINILDTDIRSQVTKIHL